jgi:hypothetical protein
MAQAQLATLSQSGQVAPECGLIGLALRPEIEETGTSNRASRAHCTLDMGTVGRPDCNGHLPVDPYLWQAWANDRK